MEEAGSGGRAGRGRLRKGIGKIRRKSYFMREGLAGIWGSRAGSLRLGRSLSRRSNGEAVWGRVDALAKSTDICTHDLVCELPAWSTVTRVVNHTIRIADISSPFLNSSDTTSTSTRGIWSTPRSLVPSITVLLPESSTRPSVVWFPTRCVPQSTTSQRRGQWN